MHNANRNVLKMNNAALKIDVAPEQFGYMLKNGATINDIVTQLWIGKLEEILLGATGQEWQVVESYQDSPSFQFTFKLGDFQCESQCWCMSRVADAFDSISEFLAYLATWPAKRVQIESEKK